VDPGAHQRALDAIAPLAQLADGGAELAPVDQDGDRCVAQDEGQLVGHEAPVERHADRADLGDGEEALHVLDAVHLQQRHAVPLRHAEPAQEVGGAVGAGVPLREGEAPVRVEVHEALDVRRELGAFREQQADVLLHAGTPLRSSDAQRGRVIPYP
jgi:hypothetical protein